jgi:protein-S-isoprenylcysteine O-methyltransferase Ste14
VIDPPNNGSLQTLREASIYSGILVAGVGTAVALSWLWLIAVALAGVYFVYSAKVEEHYLTERFPDAYPVYNRSTKMLVPLIL